jgi:hypothetical protein
MSRFSLHKIPQCGGAEFVGESDDHNQIVSLARNTYTGWGFLIWDMNDKNPERFADGSPRATHRFRGAQGVADWAKTLCLAA